MEYNYNIQSYSNTDTHDKEKRHWQMYVSPKKALILTLKAGFTNSY